MKKTLYGFACALCTLLVLPAAAQVPSYVPTDGLVGWWPFNGNANDETGNGNDGVVNGATLTEDRNQNQNSAYYFDGIVNEITVSDNSVLDQLSQGTFTLSIWYNAGPVSGSNFDGLISRGWGNSNNFFGFQIGRSGNQISFQTKGPDCGGLIQTNSQNAWYNIVQVYALADGYIESYVNGALQSSETSCSSLVSQINNDYNLRFGVEREGNLHFNGLLDDIAIYNRALTEQEIQNLYTGTTPTPCVSLPSNLQQGLVGYWPFCGNANDESGNGNDGVVNGATLTEDRFGNAGKAFSFDGVDDFIEVANSATNTITGDLTMSAWVKTIGNNGQNYQTVISKRETYWTWEYYMALSFHDGIIHNTKALASRALGMGNQEQAWSVTPYEINSWELWTVAFSLGEVHLYKNGILDYSAPFSLVPNAQNSPLLFGRNTLVDNSEQFYGTLDDIGIWNRALTPEEVQELYTLDACTFTVYDTLTVYETVYDTVYTYETIYDTVTTYVTVTDTLLIDITFTGFEGQPSWLNTVTVFPNPASDQITIDYGNFALLAGYNTIITNAAGSTVFEGLVNSQQTTIDINAWGATGVYYMSVYDAGGVLVAVRHIVLE